MYMHERNSLSLDSFDRWQAPEDVSASGGAMGRHDQQRAGSSLSRNQADKTVQPLTCTDRDVSALDKKIVFLEIITHIESDAAWVYQS